DEVIMEHTGASRRTVIGVKVRLSKVLDLTSTKVRRKIGISKSVLTETDWEWIQNIDKKEALTQSIGRFIEEAGFEAILVPSAVCKGRNLDVFPDNLLPSSEISIVNLDKLPKNQL
ncbi:MAG TPA: RES domain-containing protein, partial [Thermodesulfobacteriota bacterium]|nr:RES domain-containing protein [Thermodesulfobacteriota bacterium]